MKRKTYKNVLKAIKMIEVKGYNFEEASQIALNIFDTYENGEKPIEFYINKVATKEDWLNDQKKYGYLFQGGYSR
jgi:c-di-GMP-related signal transduction protein